MAVRRFVLSTLGLGGVYVLTLASTQPLDLLTGLVIGAVLLLVFGARLRPGPQDHEPGFVRRALWFPVFAAAVLRDVVQGTWEVALRVAHVRRLSCPGLVCVPIGERSERGVAVSALATTLSPGSVLVDVDWDRGAMLLHVIDASDPDEVRRRMQHMYDRYQRRVFP